MTEYISCPITESISYSGDRHELVNNGKYYSHKYEDGHDKKEEGEEGKYNYGSEFLRGLSRSASSFQMPYSLWLNQKNSFLIQPDSFQIQNCRISWISRLHCLSPLTIRSRFERVHFNIFKNRYALIDNEKLTLVNRLRILSLFLFLLIALGVFCRHEFP